MQRVEVAAQLVTFPTKKKEAMSSQKWGHRHFTAYIKVRSVWPTYKNPGGDLRDGSIVAKVRLFWRQRKFRRTNRTHAPRPQPESFRGVSHRDLLGCCHKKTPLEYFHTWTIVTGGNKCRS